MKIVSPPASAQPATSAFPASSQFSAASFYDVVTAPPPSKKGSIRATATEAIPTPAVVAFYGFKGGAGRSMAMAHVAALLTAQGARVCVVDLDLEAPGVAPIFGLKNEALVSGEGSVALLHQALTQPAEQPLPIIQSLRSIEVSGRKLFFLPAGRIDERYLAQIEELGVGLWHTQPQSPLARLIDELKQAEQLDLIFLDCRTGFSAMSASALFHLSDLALIFLPLSDQIWDGLEFLLRATERARQYRQRPALLLCPTMVPPGATGNKLLDGFVPKLKARYQHHLPHSSPTGGEREEDAEEPEEPVFQDGIRYELSLAESGCLDTKLQPTIWPRYEGLAERLREHLELSLGPGGRRLQGRLDARRILQELNPAHNRAFAENVSEDEIGELFVEPGNLASALERSTTLIVGAKGAGKTWLWRYLKGGGRGGSVLLPADIKFAVGHGPDGKEGGALQLTPDQLRDLDDQAKIGERGTQRAFFCLYSWARLAAALPSLRADLLQEADAKVLAAAPASQRRSLRELFSALLAAQQALELATALQQILRKDGIGSLAEALLFCADELLLRQNLHCTLLFDGLDTGFDTGSVQSWLPRQEAFSTALLQVMADVRGRCRRLSFKVFLRDDLFLRLSMQNKSHLEAAKLELRWQAADCWRIVLNLACRSEAYLRIVQELQPGAGRPWRLDEDTLRSLLFPLWGERVESGRTAKTANYIEKRTVDAQGRMFPRTLVQIVQYAMQEELRVPVQEPTPSRVLQFKSLKTGVTQASTQRVNDLKAEYGELAIYLDALQKADPTGKPDKFQQHMMKSPAIKAQKTGVHTQPDGWKKVIRRMEEVGVLGPYSADKAKLAIAPLYRTGLGVKGEGM